MHRTLQAALVCEVLLAFAPASFLVLIFWVPGFFINLGNEHQTLVEQLEPAALVFAALAGAIAAGALLTFILFGSRPLSGRVVLILSSAGLLLSGWASAGFLSSNDLKIFFLIPAGPFICGLHLLYLGRSYFAAGSC